MILFMYSLVGVDKFFRRSFPSSFGLKESAKLKLLYSYEDKLDEIYFEDKLFGYGLEFHIIVCNFNKEMEVRVMTDTFEIEEIDLLAPNKGLYYAGCYSILVVSHYNHHLKSEQSDRVGFLSSFREYVMQDISNKLVEILYKATLVGEKDGIKVYAFKSAISYYWMLFVKGDEVLYMFMLHYDFDGSLNEVRLEGYVDGYVKALLCIGDHDIKVNIECEELKRRLKCTD